MSKLGKNNSGSHVMQTFILSVDTSTKACSVAIHGDGKLIANLETYKENSHSENLVVMIDQACKLAGVQLSDIHAFVLAQGPGSYTGLRISCSSLKGLCFALDKPLIAVSTLKIMANGLKFLASGNDLICPMIDARRMEVYQGLFDSKGEVFEAEKPLIIETESYQQLLSERRIIFAGNGAEKSSGVISHPNAIFISDYHPLAKHMGDIALECYQKEEFADLAYFEPEYLKEFYTTAKIVG